jgi:uncharacterized Tic20 family protein
MRRGPSAGERAGAALAHWGGYITWIIVPLGMYLVIRFTLRNRNSLVAWHARIAFDFQMSIIIYLALALPLFGLMFIDP